MQEENGKFQDWEERWNKCDDEEMFLIL